MFVCDEHKRTDNNSELHSHSGCEFRWSFTFLRTPSSIFFVFILSFYSLSVQSENYQSHRAKPVCVWFHKQPIVMQSGLALHFIFSYLHTSSTLPPLHRSSSTPALILCHGSEMRLSPPVSLQMGWSRGWEEDISLIHRSFHGSLFKTISL